MIIYTVLYITNYNVNYNQVYQSRARFPSITDISDRPFLVVAETVLCTAACFLVSLAFTY